ncbi:hypothetical protein Taro_005049 [Colocasia esculenta]|uniref:Replication protein A 70 kDa DNA-binding subunit B/D first OB fold domain-containing protein n=1 Tax=Colocasia esculenta TaxID=4460 RepID=A0A843TP05_COLES|nr:hypothetical protein [Colocasia esculenta]
MKKSLFNKISCQLKEGNSYVITNFGVGENIGSYKPTQHAFRINFLYSTSVRECHDMLMPTKSFDFIAFEDITSNRIDVTYLVDVIGELTGIENIEEWENNGNKTKRLTFELEDEQLLGGQELSSKISQISTQSSYSLKEDLLQLTERKFLDKIRETRQESNENLELDESIKQGEQITDVDTDTFSITCSSSSITPLKRSIPDNDRGEDLSVDNVPAQHSCSKMKKIKIEKEDV